VLAYSLVFTVFGHPSDEALGTTFEDGAVVRRMFLEVLHQTTVSLHPQLGTVHERAQPVPSQELTSDEVASSSSWCAVACAVPFTLVEARCLVGHVTPASAERHWRR
jgi:hypothetical protein